MMVGAYIVDDREMLVIFRVCCVIIIPHLNGKGDCWVHFSFFRADAA